MKNFDDEFDQNDVGKDPEICHEPAAHETALSAANRVGLIKIENIVIGSRLRKLSEGKVEELAGSIQAVGLLQPVVVTEDKKLVAGLHRLKACQRLGFSEIHAVVISNRELQREIAEIDENLIRNPLTVLEQCEQLKRRKELYEALYPLTRRGGYHRQTPDDELQPEDINDNHVAYEPFSNRAAEEKKVTRRTIQRAVRIAERLDPEVKDQISDLPVALRFTQLMRLAELSPAAQSEIAERMKYEKLSFPQALETYKKRENSETVDNTSTEKTNRLVRRWLRSFAALLKQFEEFSLFELQAVIELIKNRSIDLSALQRLTETCTQKNTKSENAVKTRSPFKTQRTLPNDSSRTNFAPTNPSLPLFQSEGDEE